MQLLAKALLIPEFVAARDMKFAKTSVSLTKSATDDVKLDAVKNINSDFLN